MTNLTNSNGGLVRVNSYEYLIKTIHSTRRVQIWKLRIKN